jgi:small-conductance mechanosensitive channel
LLRQPEFHLFVFCLLFMLINWPFLAISAKSGLMSIFLYLFAIWSILILLLFLIQRSLRGNGSGEDRDKKGGG